MLGASWSDAQVLAGGTDLISMMKDFVTALERVVNIKGTRTLGGVPRHGEECDRRYGHARRSVAEPTHPQRIPFMVTAALGVSSPQIRNMGTVAGDLCQRPRCWYFRSRARIVRNAGRQEPGAGRREPLSRDFRRKPRVFRECIEPRAGVAALGAHVKIASPSGARTVAVDKFFVIPKSETGSEIELHPNEIVTEIVIPSASASMKNATYEVRQKEALDWPLATASVALKMSGGRWQCAIVMGHVAPTPWGAAAAEKALIGKSIDEASAEHAAAAAVEGAQPLSQNEYKVQLAKVAVKRALLAAAHKARYGVRQFTQNRRGSLPVAALERHVRVVGKQHASLRRPAVLVP